MMKFSQEKRCYFESVSFTDTITGLKFNIFFYVGVYLNSFLSYYFTMCIYIHVVCINVCLCK